MERSRGDGEKSTRCWAEDPALRVSGEGAEKNRLGGIRILKGRNRRRQNKTQ